MRPSIPALLAAALLTALPVLARAEGKPLKIGVLTDMNGPYGDASGAGSGVAARMAVQDFGAKVLGRPIEILIADHQNRPDVATDIARQWYDRDDV